MALCWQMKCVFCWRVWEEEELEAAQMETTLLTCSAHPTYARGFAPILCEVSVIQYMTTFKEWGHVSNLFISKFITVLWEEDTDLETKREENTPNKTHMEQTTLCKLPYSYYTVSLFTGDWYGELPSQYRFCHLIFFIFLWILVEANLVHEVVNREYVHVNDYFNN